MNSNKKWQILFNQEYTPVNQLESINGVRITVKRDDLNHNIIQGNKLRKLKFNLKSAINNSDKIIATFGGAWSNHIVATAKAAKVCGITSIGFIRGEELIDNQVQWSQSLKLASEYGMQLIFISRKDYRLKHDGKTVRNFLNDLGKKIYLLPEGGSNALAIQGVSEVIEELAEQIDEPSHIVTACGTGGTMAGLIDGVAKHKWHTQVIGIPVLKGAEFLKQDVQMLSNYHKLVNWQLYYDYHAGGYARMDEKTLNFAKYFTNNHSIKLDQIYTAKSFYAAHDLIKSNVIPPKSHVVLLHTGGLQGGVIEA